MTHTAEKTDYDNRWGITLVTRIIVNDPELFDNLETFASGENPAPSWPSRFRNQQK